jgi:hypothetical protein
VSCSSLNLLFHSDTLVLDKHFSLYALFNSCSLKPSTRQKTNFTKTAVILVCKQVETCTSYKWHL